MKKKEIFDFSFIKEKFIVFEYPQKRTIFFAIFSESAKIDNHIGELCKNSRFGDYKKYYLSELNKEVIFLKTKVSNAFQEVYNDIESYFRDFSFLNGDIFLKSFFLVEPNKRLVINIIRKQFLAFLLEKEIEKIVSFYILKINQKQLEHLYHLSRSLNISFLVKNAKNRRENSRLITISKDFHSLEQFIIQSKLKMKKIRNVKSEYKSYVKKSSLIETIIAKINPSISTTLDLYLSKENFEEFINTLKKNYFSYKKINIYSDITEEIRFLKDLKRIKKISKKN